MMLKHFDSAEDVLDYIVAELVATLRDDLNNMEGEEEREEMRDRIADIEAVGPYLQVRTAPLDTPTNNAELVQACMNFSKHGALAQAFIIDAITKQAEGVAACPPSKLAEQMKDSPVASQAWQGVAFEIKGKFDAFYKRGQYAAKEATT